jgi:hypothetical protein
VFEVDIQQDLICGTVEASVEGERQRQRDNMVKFLDIIHDPGAPPQNK